MASHTPDYYLSKYGSDQVPLTLGALQLEPADRAVLKIAGNLNELKLIYHLSSFDIDPREKKGKLHVHKVRHAQFTWQAQICIQNLFISIPLALMAVRNI